LILMNTLKTSGERTGHLASGAPPHTILRCPLDTLQATFNGGLKQEKATNCLDMEVPQFIVSPSPLLHCNFPPQAYEPSSRSVTRRHYSLVFCVNFGHGFHHSHSSFCYLTSAKADHAPTHNPSIRAPSIIVPSLTTPSEYLAKDTSMVRHRMRSRRCGTRGGSSCP